MDYFSDINNCNFDFMYNAYITNKFFVEENVFYCKISKYDLGDNVEGFNRCTVFSPSE